MKHRTFQELLASVKEGAAILRERKAINEMTPIQFDAALWGYKACRKLPPEVVRLGNFWVEFARTYDALVQAQARVEALEKVIVAIEPARKATGNFIQHIGGGKPNADRYWELRNAAEEANGVLNDALAALAASGPPKDNQICGVCGCPLRDDGACPACLMGFEYSA